MTSATIGPSIRVVVFSLGPVLESGARRFLVALENHPEIDLLAVFAQSKGSGLGAIVSDLWRRRGALALPLLLQRGLRAGWEFAGQPRETLAMRRRLRRLSGRICMIPDVHAAEVLQQVRELRPDLGLIYGSPILKPSLFEIPALGTLGIHHGKVPEYRGKKTTFWAMYNGEESAGVTIQRINERLDGGEVVGTGEVRIGRRPLWIVWRELEKLGIERYVDAILAVKRGTADYRPQQGARGPLYRDPGLRDLLIFWQRYLARLLVARRE